MKSECVLDSDLGQASVSKVMFLILLICQLDRLGLFLLLNSLPFHILAKQADVVILFIFVLRGGAVLLREHGFIADDNVLNRTLQMLVADFLLFV